MGKNLPKICIGLNSVKMQISSSTERDAAPKARWKEKTINVSFENIDESVAAPCVCVGVCVPRSVNSNNFHRACLKQLWQNGRK